MANSPQPGEIGWLDLTIPNATLLSEFYSQVVGWKIQPIPMGEYSDYCMNSADGTTRAGVCHARGINSDIPPMWIPYFVVADLEKSLTEATNRGAKVVSGPRGDGDRFVIIQDPAGATCALYQKKPAS